VIEVRNGEVLKSPAAEQWEVVEQGEIGCSFWRSHREINDVGTSAARSRAYHVMECVANDAMLAPLRRLQLSLADKCGWQRRPVEIYG